MARPEFVLQIEILDQGIVDELLEELDRVPEPWCDRLAAVLERWIDRILPGQPLLSRLPSMMTGRSPPG